MKRLWFIVLAIIVNSSVSAQADYEPLGNETLRIAERLEIKSGSLKNDLHYGTRPMKRKDLTNFILELDTASSVLLTDMDFDNIRKVYLENNDLIPADKVEDNINPFLRHFFKTPGHFLDVHNDDVDIHVDPVLFGHIGYDKDVSDSYGYQNTRGIEIRATIDKKVSLYSRMTENQVRFPNFVKHKIDSNFAVPGYGFWKRFKTDGYDYFEPKGSISIDATKNITAQLGYDKHFIGDGYRSLFLSDNANNYLFLKLNTKVWKFNYTNLYTELLKDGRNGPDTLKGKKYMVSHHLSFDATDWLNIGVFESIVFGRENNFEFHYLNPVIFYRAVEQQVGSPDNAAIGLNYSAIAKSKLKFYGQLLIDEFRINDISSGNKSWANKFAFQQGIKYVDAFGLENMDLQVELNRVRPYTYQHFNLISNYNHYGQSLAHPLGANFTEVMAQGFYEPFDRLQMQGIVTYADYGTSVDGRSWGNDVVNLTYNDRPFENGVITGQGLANETLNVQARASYELKPTMFIDLNGFYKKHKKENAPTVNETYTGASFRWNFRALDYNY